MVGVHQFALAAAAVVLRRAFGNSIRASIRSHAATQGDAPAFNHAHAHTHTQSPSGAHAHSHAHAHMRTCASASEHTHTHAHTPCPSAAPISAATGGPTRRRSRARPLARSARSGPQTQQPPPPSPLPPQTCTGTRAAGIARVTPSETQMTGTRTAPPPAPTSAETARSTRRRGSSRCKQRARPSVHSRTRAHATWLLAHLSMPSAIPCMFTRPDVPPTPPPRVAARGGDNSGMTGDTARTSAAASAMS